jgi:fatty-acyl-CoA synthase
MSMTRDGYQAVIDRSNEASMQVALHFDFTIADRVEDLAASQPDDAFLIHEGERITYSDVNTRAEDYARIAIARGIGKDDVVALMIENRPEFLYAWFGLLKIGAIASLINTQAKSTAVTHAVTVVGSKLAFIGSECMERYLTGDDLCSTVPTILIPDGPSPGTFVSTGTIAFSSALKEAAEVEYTSRSRAGLRASDICCYMFTSGTTGLPKAAMITHSKWLSAGARWICSAGIDRDDVFYGVLPLFHGAALMSMFSAVLAVGGSAVLRRRFSASRFWEDVAEHRITVFQYVGEICRYLVNAPAVSGEKEHTLEVLLGAGMGIDVWTQFVARFGDQIRIYEGYGSTESNCSLINLDNKPGSCGRIPYWDRTFIRHVKYDVEAQDHARSADGFLIQAKPGETGELIGQVSTASGDMVSPFDGYSDDAATQKKLLRDVFETGDVWFSTGDLLRRDEEDYFYFVDRVGDTYRWKSENVSTTEAVHELSAYSDAEIINVYGVQVPAHEGRAGMAALVMEPGKSFDPDGFYRLATSALPHYAVPLFVRVCPEMDMTGTYKLRKVDLQKQGYDPARFADELYLLDHDAKRYAPYSAAGLEALRVEPFA